MKAIIVSSDNFVREATIQSIDALMGTFSLQFHSRLLSAKNPDGSQRNFEAILDREGLKSLKRLLDAALDA